MRNIIVPGAPPLRSVLRPAPLRSHPGLRRHQTSGRDKPPAPAGGATSDGTRKSEAIPVPNTIAPLPLWQRLGPLTKAAMAYARVQKRRPWGTQFVSALVIYSLADLSAQSITHDDGFDLERTGRSMVIGGIAAIPSYSWFIFLSHHFNYASHFLSLATKVVVSQTVFAPIFNTYFFGMQAFLSGSSVDEIVDRVATTVPTSLLASCRFWPIVTAFSFSFVPMEHRSVFNGVIAIGWQTYLALLNRRAEVREHSVDTDAAAVVNRPTS